MFSNKLQCFTGVVKAGDRWLAETVHLSACLLRVQISVQAWHVPGYDRTQAPGRAAGRHEEAPRVRPAYEAPQHVNFCNTLHTGVQAWQSSKSVHLDCAALALSPAQVNRSVLGAVPGLPETHCALLPAGAALPRAWTPRGASCCKILPT